MDEEEIRFSISDRGEVVLVVGDGRIALGPKEEVCEAMCRFLAELDYGDCS